MDLKINQKFKDLLDPLSDEELSQLEESILSDGVRESIKAWNNQIIDGHNRHAICQKHDLPYPVMNMFFADEDAVLEWIYTNQLGRRNLSDHQKTLHIGRLYNLRKLKQGAPEGSKNAAKIKEGILNPLISDSEKEPEKTAEKIAKEFKVNESTVKRAGKIAEVLEENPELKERFINKEITKKEILGKMEDKEEIPIPPNEQMTKMVRHHSERLQKKLQELSNAVVAAQASFQANGLRFSDFAPKISRLQIRKLELEANKIKGE